MRNIYNHSEIKKTFSRFNKIRIYHNYGFMNILPISQLLKKPNNYKQIQLNTDTHFNAIIMDIDDEEFLTEWNLVGLPTPTIQTLNKLNNKAHLIWLLNVPISKKNKKAVQYYRDIVNSIKVLIGADRAYQNHQTKNFLNTDLYRTTYNDVAYNLADFNDFICCSVSQKNYFSNDRDDFEATGSRHIDLFNQLRVYGYSIAKRKDLKERLEKRAESINNEFENPIKTRSIVKSVFHFCVENRNNFRNRNNSNKPMKFKKIANLSRIEYAIEVSKRQKKAAFRTAKIKALKTSGKIKVSIDKLVRHKTKITYSRIAKIAKLSLRTVKNYTKLIKLSLKKINGAISSIRVIVLRVEERNIKPLKHSLAIKYFSLLSNST